MNKPYRPNYNNMICTVCGKRGTIAELNGHSANRCKDLPKQNKELLEQVRHKINSKRHKI